MKTKPIVAQCNHCLKERRIVFSYLQQVGDKERTLILCSKCLEVMVLSMFCWNSDLPNKAFNYVKTVPAP